MLRAGETPLWPDATTRFPVLLFSHGYGEARSRATTSWP